MTNDAIRRKIAEACGWKFRASAIWQRQWLDPEGIACPFSEVPNYPEPHDAMQEALGTLNGDELSRYAIKLAIIVIRDNNPRHVAMQVRLLLSSPLQKAEAFLRAKGLWEE